MSNVEQRKYTAACYCRLSKDDLQDGTSVSIETQRKVLEDYCNSNNYSVFDFYCDDGFTGTNFDRPNFKRMMSDVKDGIINMIVVKDLSRLGRNYIETGKLIEETFPENGVRFIAIGDDVDTDRENLDLDFMLPMKNIFNQYYPADCSRKTRQAFKTKAMRGEFIGANAPYGYRKSLKDKHVLEIDEMTAPIVREIFEMAAYKGYGYNKIARELSKRKVLTPTAYRCQIENKIYDKDPYDWNLTSVRRILENSEYLGCVVNGKKKKLSFKSKRVISVAANKWIVVNNTHEPIIPQQLWDDVHRQLGSRKRTNKAGNVNMFAGLVKCDKCGYALTMANTKSSKHYFSCSTYKRKGKEACTIHYIKYDDLYQIILTDIQEKLRFIHGNEEMFARRLQSELGSISDQKTQLVQKEVQEVEKRLHSIDEKFDKMYEDRLEGLLPDRKFREMVEKSESEREKLIVRLDELKVQLNVHETLDDNVLQFVDAVRKYTNIHVLDRELLNRLIDKIVVGNKTKNANGYTQQITIHYRFIGDLDNIDLFK